MLAQWRHKEGNHVQAIKKVFPEVSFLNLLFEILVGSADNSYVHGQIRPGANRGKALFLDHAQHFRLSAQAHIANLVQEERASICQFEPPDLVFMRARESSLDVAKQLALQESGRQGGAMNFDESLVAPRAVGMQGAGEKFFAGATFTANQNGGLGG